MRTLEVSTETFTNMISGLVKSGVTFNASEQNNGTILITFNGGY